jgi:hypothetical protein
MSFVEGWDADRAGGRASVRKRSRRAKALYAHARSLPRPPRGATLPRSAVRSSPASTVTPLAPLLGFAALASFAAGTATLSVFFVTRRAPYEFTAVQQYALGLLVGATYTVGALAAAPVRLALARRGRSARLLLALLSLVMAALTCIPLVAASDAAVYAYLALYAPLTGLFWPLVEAYVSGGRRAGALRSAMGRFNVTWSATLVPSFLLIPPLLEIAPGAVFVAVALAHVLSIPLLALFRRDPGEHVDEHHAVPTGYVELLRVHRVLHAMSYLVMYALSPYLPTLLERVGIGAGRASAVAALWLAARVASFAALERWHGWHGRWWVAWGGAGLVLAGFGATVLAPGGGGLPLLLAGLVLFGAGLAALYTAALYYSFEVGGSDGGGSHEALIGLGYTVGPACGLLVCGLERGGIVGGAQRESALLLVITVLCSLLAALAWRTRRKPSVVG